MNKRKDIVGQKFGHLFVLEYLPDVKMVGRNCFYKCLCDCGNVVVVRGDNLRGGHSAQCKQCGHDIQRQKIKRKEHRWW